MFSIRSIWNWATAAVAAVVAAAAGASPVRSSLGTLRDFEQRDYTAADYVQDGLIAKWDGIENAGWGEHISSGKWVDLIGGLQSISTGEFTDNANIARYGTAGQFEFSGAAKFAEIYRNFTVEVVLVDGDYQNASYTHSLQWILKDTDSNIRTLFQGTGVLGNLTRIGDWRHFVNVTSTIDIGMFREHRDGGYIRALAQTFDGYSNKAYRDGLLVHVEDRGIDWEAQSGTMAYRLRVYNTAGIFRFHALRIYSRPLSETEVRYNNLVDRMRFGL